MRTALQDVGFPGAVGAGRGEDAEKPNKSYYDPRKWLREAWVERVQKSCVDHSNVN